MLVGQPLNRRRSHLSATMQTGSHPSIQLLQLVHVHVLQPFSPQVMQQPAVKLVHFSQPLRHTAMRCPGDVCRKASQQPAKDTAECCDAEPKSVWVQPAQSDQRSKRDILLGCQLVNSFGGAQHTVQHALSSQVLGTR